jgi:hypothetical protein
MFDVVIGLGHCCYTAQHLRRMMIHPGTMPFDWIISSNEGVAAAIETEFEGRLRQDQLELKHDRIIDLRFGFAHLHEFPIRADFLAHHQQVVQRQQLLERRFQNVLGSKARLLFVRHALPEESDQLIPQRLVDAIARWRPLPSFHLLYLTEMAPLRTGRVTETLTVLKVSPDMGNTDRDWDSIFSDLHSYEPIRAYYPRLVRGVTAAPESLRSPTRRVIGETRRWLIQRWVNRDMSPATNVRLSRLGGHGRDG